MFAAVPRIASPGLCKVVTFALDEEGYLSDHACQYLFPRRGSSKGFDGFSRDLGKALGREVSEEEAVIASVKRLWEGKKPEEASKVKMTLDKVVGRILSGEPSPVSKGKRTG